MSMTIKGFALVKQGLIKIQSGIAAINWFDLSTLSSTTTTGIHPDPVEEAASQSATSITMQKMSKDSTRFMTIYRTFVGSSNQILTLYSVSAGGGLTVLDSVMLTDDLNTLSDGDFAMGTQYFVLPTNVGYRVYDLTSDSVQTSVHTVIPSFNDDIVGHPTLPVFYYTRWTNGSTTHIVRPSFYEFNPTTLVHVSTNASITFSDGINASVINTNATRSVNLSINDAFTKVVTSMTFDTVGGDSDVRVRTFDIDVPTKTASNIQTLISNTSSGTPETNGIRGQNIPGTNKFAIKYATVSDSNTSVVSNKWRVYDYTTNALLSSFDQTLTGASSPTSTQMQTLASNSLLPSGYTVSRPFPLPYWFNDRMMHVHHDWSLNEIFVFTAPLVAGEFDFTGWPTNFDAGTIPITVAPGIVPQITANGSILIIMISPTTSKAEALVITN